MIVKKRSLVFIGVFFLIAVGVVASAVQLELGNDFAVKDGNVGIGTNNPTAKLEIYGGGNILLKDDATPGNDAGDLVFQGTDGTEFGRLYSSPDTIVLSAGTNTAPELVIKSDGRIGIGTETPGAGSRSGDSRLDVKGNIMFDSVIETPLRMHLYSGEHLYLLAGNNNDVLVSSNWGGSGNLRVSNNVITNNGYLFAEVGDDSGLVHGGDGNIRLRTNGVDRLEVDAIGNIQIGGTVTAAFYAQVSDKRLKNIQASFEPGLDEVTQLEPILFSYKENNKLNLPSGRTFVGAIAQDVKKVIPEAVNLADNGYYTLNSDTVMWTMVNAIKELKAENEALKEIVCSDSKNAESNFCLN